MQLEFYIARGAGEMNHVVLRFHGHGHMFGIGKPKDWCFLFPAVYYFLYLMSLTQTDAKFLGLTSNSPLRKVKVGENATSLNSK